MCRWACEFKAIIEEEWDKGIYDTVFTVVNPYPEQVLRHFLGQLSEIRELENEYGIDKNKIFWIQGHQTYLLLIKKKLLKLKKELNMPLWGDCRNSWLIHRCSCK